MRLFRVRKQHMQRRCCSDKKLRQRLPVCLKVYLPDFLPVGSTGSFFHSSVSLKMFVSFIFIVKILGYPEKPNFV